MDQMTWVKNVLKLENDFGKWIKLKWVVLIKMDFCWIFGFEFWILVIGFKWIN